MTIYNRRRATNLVILTLSLCATGLGLLILFLILGALLYNGVPALTPSTFRRRPLPAIRAGSATPSLAASS
jgi:ABC-type phosphate transport system permease subunit